MSKCSQECKLYTNLVVLFEKAIEIVNSVKFVFTNLNFHQVLCLYINFGRCYLCKAMNCGDAASSSSETVMRSILSCYHILKTNILGFLKFNKFNKLRFERNIVYSLTFRLYSRLFFYYLDFQYFNSFFNIEIKRCKQSHVSMCCVCFCLTTLCTLCN